MYKKIAFFISVLLLVGCSSSKPSIQTSKKKKTTTVSHRNTNRQVNKTVSERKKESETLEATSQVRTTTDVVSDYINSFKEIAKDNMRLYKIPASITLAQGILESGAGRGHLSQVANNHFGIKCHKEWTGPSVRHDDDAAQECFRKYEHASESYRDHSLFLTTRSRYENLFKLAPDDYAGWARGLRAAGYATDPKYPDKLIGIIERYQLHQYDAEVLGKPVQAIVSNVSSGSGTYVVEQGDTLYSISKRFNTTVEAIKRINNLKDNSISIGQILKVK